jgi:hypothetical protein
VTWLHGDATVLDGALLDGRKLSADLAIMTGNVAQVFVSDDDWSSTLDGTAVLSASTLRFRPREEVEADLVRHGFQLDDVRDAPDRPGLELVFLARRTQT